MKRISSQQSNQQRRGVIIVFACVMLAIVLGFAAFTVDFGMVTLTKGQMQNAADSAAHAAVLEVSRSFGPGGELTEQQAEALARSSAVDMISRFRTGDVETTTSDTVRDVRIGRRTWNDTQSAWVEEWGVAPYNMVEVTVRRTKDETTSIPMAFAQILGRDEFDLTTTSVASLQPGSGFYLPPGSPPADTIDILPIALDLGSWNNLLDQVYGTSTGTNSNSNGNFGKNGNKNGGNSNSSGSDSGGSSSGNTGDSGGNTGDSGGNTGGGSGNGNSGNSGNGNSGNSSSGGGQSGTGNATVFTDEYQWDSVNGILTQDASDGIPEINIYPDLNSGLAPGNRGTVDIGHPGNSTADLKRQIVHGINAYDMSFFPNNKLQFDSNGALYLNGDTGISAGIESSLQQIVGQVRAIPIFISVTGNGNNATYTVVKFVGVRIMGCTLSGGPSNRHLTVQPAVFSDSHVLRDDLSVNVDSILSQPLTIR